MHKAILLGFLAAGLAAPASGYAQTVTVPAPASIATDQLIVVRPAQWAAIAAGVVVGAIVLDMALPSDVAFIVGGAVGGYIANVWYTGHQLEIHMGSVPKT